MKNFFCKLNTSYTFNTGRILQNISSKRDSYWKIIKTTKKSFNYELLIAYNHPYYRNIGLLKISYSIPRILLHFVPHKNQPYPADNEIIFLFAKFLEYLHSEFPKCDISPIMLNHQPF